MANTTTNTGDIFTVIAKRDAAATAKAAPRTVKRYFVCVGSYERMHSRRVYEYSAARKLAARAKRLGLADAYVSMPVTWTV
jgi:hypothetical protein